MSAMSDHSITVAQSLSGSMVLTKRLKPIVAQVVETIDSGVSGAF